MALKQPDSLLLDPENSIVTIDEHVAPILSPLITSTAATAVITHNKSSATEATSNTASSTCSKSAQNTSLSRKRKVLAGSLDVVAWFQNLDSKLDRGDVADPLEPYDPTCEKLPCERVSVFRPGFAEAESIITQQVVQYVLNAICRLQRTYPSTELDHMEHRTKGLLLPSYRSPIIVGVRGPAGAGKTSLINAILSTGSLAHTSSGKVGTYVPIEYLPLAPQQPTPYAFEISSFSLEDAQKSIHTHWKDYYSGHLCVDEESLESAGTIDLVKPAREMFLALFSDRPEFENETTGDAFLGQAESVNDTKVLPKLLAWGRDRHNKLSTILGKQPFLAHTVSDLSELMEPYVQTSACPYYGNEENVGLKSSVWPFIKLGRVALSNPLLEAGLILADLPGISDCNAQRVRLTQDFLKKCRVTIIVHTIKRAGDSEEPKQSILEAWRRRRDDSVTVVLTHADELGDESSCRDPLEPEEEVTMSDLKAHKNAVAQKLKKVKAELNSSRVKKDRELQLNLFEEKARYESHTRYVNVFRKRILMHARNRHCKKELQSWFKERTKFKTPLAIFCVSTTAYLELIKEDEERSIQYPPTFTPESTEIVALRRHLLTMVNKRGQEHTMVNYYRLVKHLLNEMSLACAGFKPMYKRDYLLKIISDTHESFPKACSIQRRNFENNWLKPVLDNTNMKEWVSKAERVCDKWGSFNPITFSTFLKREGIHKTQQSGKQNWNRTLLDFAAEDLEPPLGKLCDKGCASFYNQLMQIFRTKLDEMEYQLRSNLDPTQTKLFREFFDNIQIQTKDLDVQVRDVVTKMKDGFLKLTHESVSPEPKSSPFPQAMKALYAQTMHLHPPKSGKPNVHNNRRTTFKARVMDKTSGPYAAIKTHIETQAAGLLQDAESALKACCDDVFEKVMYNFDQICPVQKDGGFQALERGGELKRDVEVAMGVLEGPVREALRSAGIKVT